MILSKAICLFVCILESALCIIIISKKTKKTIDLECLFYCVIGFIIGIVTGITIMVICTWNC